MTGRVFIDTNVIVYAFDESYPLRWAQAIHRIEQARRNGRPIVSPNILGELYNALTKEREDENHRPLPAIFGHEEAVAALDWVAVNMDVRDLVTRGVVMHGVRLVHERQMQTWDAIHLASAISAGCERFLTADRGFPRKKAVEDIVVERLVPPREKPVVAVRPARKRRRRRRGSRPEQSS